MGKRDQHFLKVREYKERFAKEPTETLARRLHDHQLIKEAAIAAREVLDERGASVDGFQSDGRSDD